MFRQPQHRLAGAIVPLLALACSSAAGSGLLKDIAPGAAASYDDIVGFWLPFDGDVVFWAKGSLGIWRTDGTTAGTTMIQPYVGSLSPVNAFSSYGIAADQAVFFYADDSFYGSELWRTDGTNNGALRLTDIGAGSQPANISYWITSNGVFYFQINATLYKTPGTTPASVTTVFGGGTDEGSATVLDLRGKLIFSCGINFLRGPCVRDTSGTVTLLKQLSVTSPYVAVNERVFFTATTVAEGNELWVTDGTIGGTKIVADLVLGAADSDPSDLTRMDDRLYFIARDMTHGRELWTSDGTGPGTVMIADLNPNSGNGASKIYAAIDSTLYFNGSDATTAFELFRSNGSVGNVSLVKDVNPSGGISGYATAVNGRLIMGLDTGSTTFATTPWISDGTANGTLPLDPNTGLTTGNHLVAANGKLIFPGLQKNSTAGLEPLEINLERVTGHKWCSRPEKTIPDKIGAVSGVLTDTMKIPQWGAVESLTVDVDIAHTYVHDLVVQLIAPDATSVNLINQPTDITGGSCTGDLVILEFSDSAIFPICASARFAYPPHSQHAPPQPLASFAGKSTKGKWTLKVTDAGLGDIGTLHEWCVNFKTDRIFEYGYDD